MILYFVKRLQNLKFINKVIVATSNENSDNKLYEILDKNNIFVYRGPLNNVYSRYRNCLFIHKCDYFIRLSADSPFVNLNLIQKFINIIRNNKGIDILTNIKNKTFPKGQSIEICNAKIPSIVVYKMNFINFLIIKILVKIKFANIVNIVANEQIIPELLQDKCNPNNIYKVVSEFLDTPSKIKEQVQKTELVLDSLKTEKSSSELASQALNKFF